MKRPVYPLLICYSVGLILADRFSLSWLSPGAIWAILLLSLSSIWLLYHKKYRLVTTILLIIFVALGISRYTLHQTLPAHHLVHVIQDDQVVTLEGWLYKPRESFPEQDRLYLEAETLDRGDIRQPVTGKIRVTIRKVPTTHGIPNLQYGDKLRIRTRLRVPTRYQNPGTFDYKTYLARQGIHLTGFLGHYSPYLLRRLETGGGLWLFRYVYTLREKMLVFVNSFSETSKESEFPPLKETRENPELEIADEDQSLTEEQERLSVEGENGILQAMILGDKTALSPELQESFRLSGLYHLLVVSGGNVWILVGFFLILSKLLRIRSQPRLFGVIGLIFLYALLTGFEPPVVRASIMVTLFFLATLFDRNTDPFYSLVVSAMILLFMDPTSLFEASFQLTIMATAAILYTYRVFPKNSVPESLNSQDSLWGKVKAFFMGITLSTLFVEVATAPLIVYYFNHVYPYGLLANILALPLSTMILSLGVLACGLNFFIPLLAQYLLIIDLFLVRLFISIAHFIANLPYSELPVSTRFIIPLSLSYLFVFGIQYGLKRPLLQKIGLGFIVMFVIFFAYFLVPRINIPPLRITFLDVGQGDSSVMELPDGTTLLFDGGGSSYRSAFDVGRSILAPYLWYHGISKVDVLVISHAHMDHFQGFRHLLEKFDVGEVWISPWESQNSLYQEILQIARSRGILPLKLEQGYHQRFGEVDVRILHPSSIYIRETIHTSDHLANNYSLVLKLTYGKVCFLFPGDIEQEAEQFLIQSGTLETCTILKAPHHGSGTSSSLEFLETLQPSVIVISTGKYKHFENLSPLVLEKYQRAGIQIYRTDKDGAIRIETDGTRYKVKTFREGF
jgi:competence protein ComEC